MRHQRNGSSLSRPTQSLQARLLVMLGGTLLITLIIVVLGINQLAADAERASWLERQSAAINNAALYIQGFIDQSKTDVLLIASVAGDADLDELVQNTVDANAGLLEMVVFNAQGETAAFASHLETPSLLPAADWLTLAQAVPAATVYISEWMLTPQAAPYLIMATATADSGVVAAAVDMSLLTEVLANIRFGETGNAYLANGDGLIIAHTDPQVVQAGVRLTALPEASEYTNFQEVAVLGVSKAIPGTDWTILTEVAQNEVFAASRNAIIPFIVFVTLFWGGAMATTAWVIHRRLFVPLANLYKGQQAVAQGDLHQQVDIDIYDEVGVVVEKFNGMVLELRQRVLERDRNEVKLKESEKRYRELIENVSDIVYSTDARGHFTYVSPSAALLTGYPESEMVGRHFTEVIDPEWRERLLTFYRQQAKNQESETFLAFPIVTALGERRWLEQKTSLMFDDSQRFVGFQSISRDVTESRLHQLEIEHTTQLLAQAQAIGHMGNWEWNLLTGEMYWSDEIYRIYGLEPGSLAETETYDRWITLLHPDDRAAAQAAISRALEGEPYDDVTRVVLPDGAVRYVQNRGEVTFDENRKPTAMIGIMQDITERKLAEQQIQAQNDALVKANFELSAARKQAETANKLKSQFLATMSHELRTPLNAVIGYAQLQLAGMVGELNAEQHEFQERILVNAQHLLQLINEVLDLSKIEAGRMELMAKPFNLRECLDEIVLQNKVLAENKGLEFRLNVGEQLPEIIVEDRGRIKQIIINLVSNAIKFTDEGSVTIDAAIHQGNNWRITVTDTGTGIAPHLQETIFDEFRQAENGLHRGGTGLGLAIARKLVLMMGGNIRLNSEIGRGSVFTVTLPLVTEGEHQAASELSEV